MDHICQHCGAGFSRPGNRMRRFCSRKCADAHPRPQQPTTKVKAACLHCESEYEDVPSKIALGRKFCSHECSVEYRSKVAKAAKAVQACEICGASPVASRGLCNAHYQQLITRFGATARWESKTCPTCNGIFVTSRDRKFCSLDCYISSDLWKEIRDAENERRAAARTKCECLQCAAKMELRPCESGPRQFKSREYGPRRFCSRACWRLYAAGRFDRYVAEFNVVNSPQSFDEFLSQSELPCLIDGCSWVGCNLSQHMNFTHGINASDFKALAGFNATTGVVCAPTSTELSRRAKEMRKAGVLVDSRDQSKMVYPTNPKWRMRAEGREHCKKAAAEVKA